MDVVTNPDPTTHTFNSIPIAIFKPFDISYSQGPLASFNRFLSSINWGSAQLQQSQLLFRSFVSNAQP